MNTKKKINDFPFFEQTGMMECGTTCLAMIFKYYGFYNIQRVLAQLGEVTTEGTDLQTISEIAQNFGFKTEAYEMEYKYLLEIQLPCIAHFDGYHFIVIYKATHDRVWVADPAYGLDSYGREDFCQRWNGVVLVLEPGTELFKNKDMLEMVEASKEKNKSLYAKFYKPAIAPYKRLMYKILVATFFLQVSALAVPIFTQTIVDQVLVHGNKHLLFAILLGMGLVFGIQILFLYIRNILLVQFKIVIEYEFFSRFFAHFISLFQGYYDRHKREDFINRFRENVRIRQMANPAVLQTLVDMIFILGYLPLLCWYNLHLGLTATLLTFFYIITSFYYTPKIRSLANKVFYKDVGVLGKFLDVLLGIRTVKLLGIEQIKYSAWQNEYRRNLNTVMEAERTEIGLITIQRTLFFLSQIVIFWLGSYFVFTHQLSLGQYLAFITIFMIVLNALNNVSVLWIEIANLSVAIARLNDVLVQESEYDNNITKFRVSEINSIEIKEMSFKYHDKDDFWILENINLTLKKGQHIGIAGRNGAGKTTLVKLLLNLYPRYNGKILFNGLHDLKQVNLRDLRQKVFLFPQDIYLFDGTIRENILYANPSASEEDVVKAAWKADLHEFIKGLHLGYNHHIGELGANLSGGQRLKIGFARLFISNPDVIILDEASSQLDIETEKKILTQLKQTFKDKIVISIAHRLNTLRDADRILVLDHGKIVEDGTHEELMEINDGLYKKFINTYVNF